IAKKIKRFRELGFSVKEIASMLLSSPSLTIGHVADNIRKNLKKLHEERDSLERKIKDAEKLLSATNDEKMLSSDQKDAFRSMAYTALQDWSIQYVKSRLKKKKNGV